MSGGGFKATVDVALLIQGGILLALFLFIFGPALPALYNDWFIFKQFSHGLLVPFIAGYMVWRKRRKLQTTPINASWYGMILIVPSLIIALAGKAIGDSFTERVGMVLCMGGVIWLIFGWQFFKELLFPLGYLFLMIPLPYAIVSEVAFRLRIFDAAAAAPLLRLLGIPVYRDNYFLHLPDVTLEVADLCSGISSVFSLFALGGAYVFLAPMRPRLKVLAVFSTIPFAVLINLLRIIITAALSYYVSLSVLNMLIHELTGTITFFVALGFFVLCCEILQRQCVAHLLESGTSRQDESSTDRLSPLPLRLAAVRSWGPALLGATLLVLVAYFAGNVTGQSEKSLAHELANIGTRVAGYQMDDFKGAGFYKDPGADIEISKIFAAVESTPIELYVGFKGKQESNKLLKSPRLGFPYGWNFVWVEPTRIASGNQNVAIDANWMLTQNGQHRVLVLYWFQTGDQTVAGEFGRRIVQIRNALFYGRSDGAVVRLATPVLNSDNIEEAKNRLARFAADLYPRLLNVLPI